MTQIRGASYSLLEYFCISKEIVLQVRTLSECRDDITMQRLRLQSDISSLIGTQGYPSATLTALEKALSKERLKGGSLHFSGDTGLPAEIASAVSHLEASVKAQQLVERRLEVALGNTRAEEKRSLKRLLSDYHSQITNELGSIPQNSPHHRTHAIVTRMLHNLERENVKPSRYFSAVKTALRITTKTNGSPTSGWNGTAIALARTPVVSGRERGIPVSQRVREPDGPVYEDGHGLQSRNTGTPTNLELRTTPWPAERILRGHENGKKPLTSERMSNGSRDGQIQIHCVWREAKNPYGLSATELPDAATQAHLRRVAEIVRNADTLREFRFVVAHMYKLLCRNERTPYLEFLLALQNYAAINERTRCTPLAALVRRAIRNPSNTPIGIGSELFTDTSSGMDKPARIQYRMRILKGGGGRWVLSGVSAKHHPSESTHCLAYSISADFGYPPNARRPEPQRRILYPYTEDIYSESRDADLTLQDLYLHYSRGSLILSDPSGTPILLREQLPVDSRIIPFAARILDALFSPSAYYEPAMLNGFSQCEIGDEMSGLQIKGVRKAIQEGNITILRKAWRLAVHGIDSEERSPRSVIDALVGWERLGLPSSFYYRLRPLSGDGQIADGRSLFGSVKLLSTFELFWRQLQADVEVDIEAADPDPTMTHDPLTEITVDVEE